MTNKAICFIRDLFPIEDGEDAADSSCIGLRANTPKMGMISSDVSIFKFKLLTSFFFNKGNYYRYLSHRNIKIDTFNIPLFMKLAIKGGCKW
ncbi:MAG: hypothetical protein EOP34_11210 [Rickettsiales bacterium]|nr:MAG: hypothetical protein EOP34_11210 [Rickettsiales bacterium]